MSSSNARAESPDNSGEFSARAAIKQILAEFRQMKKEVVPLAPNSTGTALKVVKAMREKNPHVAFSIENTYPDSSYDESAGILVFSGEGRHHPDANVSQSKKKPGTDKVKIWPQGYEDQKETARNKALINSFLENIPIRVIRGDPSRMAHDEGKYKYEGLFKIEKYEQKKGLHNNLVYT
ncbi:hypothetical protein R1flu_000592 [Riccia fluitans]|uniref:YDG domain-containing protein n=1 Tax=Riccia fluitans TaxID=41844 RepID=A0ABD1Y421_9MARC